MSRSRLIAPVASVNLLTKAYISDEPQGISNESPGSIEKGDIKASKKNRYPVLKPTKKLFRKEYLKHLTRNKNRISSIKT